MHIFFALYVHCISFKKTQLCRKQNKHLTNLFVLKENDLVDCLNVSWYQLAFIYHLNSVSSQYTLDKSSIVRKPEVNPKIFKDDTDRWSGLNSPVIFPYFYFLIFTSNVI